MSDSERSVHCMGRQGRGRGPPVMGIHLPKGVELFIIVLLRARPDLSGGAYYCVA